MAKVWFISDTHFDHANIIQYSNRPFADKYVMTEELIERWNSVVGENDTVFHLGDVFICGAQRAEEIASRLNGRKILIRGNHDKFSRGKYLRMGFDVHDVYYYEGYLLTHKPFNEGALKTALNYGLLKGNICGHVHEKIDHLDREIYRVACVELFDYKPIDLNQLKAEANDGIK